MMLRRATLISIALLVVPAAASFAANITELGTAGSYRSYPLANCGQPYSAQIQGACDPPPVNDALSPGKKIQGHLERAQRLLLLARMPQARIAADQAIELDPRNVPALKFRARLALNMQDSETAWHDVNAALKRAPTDSDLLATKAELRSLRQEKGLALQDATAAVQADPRNTDALYIRARMLKQADQLDAAMADLNSILLLDPTYRLARLLRAETHMRMGNFEATLSDTGVLINQYEREQSALKLRATAHYALGHLAEAADDLTSLLGPPGDVSGLAAADRFSRPLLLQRLLIFMKLGRRLEAQQDVDALLSNGGKRGMLQLQLFLRRNGFVEVRLDGERDAAMEEALRSCVMQDGCHQALSQRI